jgi:hypothetical protein
MNQARSFRILLLVLGVSAAVWAAHATASRANGPAPAPTANGSYAVTFHVATPTTVPDGATIACQASVSPKLSVLDHLDPAPAPAESVKGIGKVIGSSANCTVQVPFAFKVSDPGVGAALSYRIEAFTPSGPAFLRTQQGIAVAYPKGGKTENIGLNINL